MVALHDGKASWCRLERKKKGRQKRAKKEQYEPQRAQLHLENNSFAVFPCYVTMFFNK